MTFSDINGNGMFLFWSRIASYVGAILAPVAIIWLNTLLAEIHDLNITIQVTNTQLAQLKTDEAVAIAKADTTLASLSQRFGDLERRIDQSSKSR